MYVPLRVPHLPSFSWIMDFWLFFVLHLIFTFEWIYNMLVFLGLGYLTWNFFFFFNDLSPYNDSLCNIILNWSYLVTIVPSLVSKGCYFFLLWKLHKSWYTHKASRNSLFPVLFVSVYQQIIVNENVRIFIPNSRSSMENGPGCLPLETMVGANNLIIHIQNSYFTFTLRSLLWYMCLFCCCCCSYLSWIILMIQSL